MFVPTQTVKNPAPRQGARGPLLTFVSWELRRHLGQPSLWLMLLPIVALFLLCFSHLSGSMVVDQYDVRFLSPTRSNAAFTGVTALVYGLVTLFIAPVLVARDWRSRTHEVLMSTPIPRWAYVWGRFLAVLAIELGVAVLLLLCYLLVAWLRDGSLLAQASAEQRAAWAAPNMPAILASWALYILPITVLLSGLGFALALLWPRRAGPVVLGLGTLWLLSTAIFAPVALNLPYWDPQGFAVFELTGDIFFERNERAYWAELRPYVEQRLAAWEEQVAQGLVSPDVDPNIQPPEGLSLRVLRVVEQEAPDLSPWLPSRLIWAGTGLLAVALAAAFFRRRGAQVG